MLLLDPQTCPSHGWESEHQFPTPALDNHISASFSEFNLVLILFLRFHIEMISCSISLSLAYFADKIVWFNVYSDVTRLEELFDYFYVVSLFL